MFFTPPAVAPPTFSPATPATTPVQVAKTNPAPHGWTTYTVRPGDSVYAIAARQRTTVAAIVVRNKLTNHGRTIHAGQKLSVPRTAARPAPARTAKAATSHTTYTVKAGDTLSHIAQAHRTTVATIARLSGISASKHIFPGQRIVLAATHAPATSTASKRPAAKKPVTRTSATVTVRRGDTVWSLARRHGSTVAAVTKTNHLSGARILVGQKLLIPGAVNTSAQKSSSAKKATATKNNTFAGRTYPDHIVSAAEANRNALSATSSPSRSQVKQMIIATAHRHGVDPKLALAIGWQESGWDQKQVSVANAIGVMQVIPDSGDWASSMVGRKLNLRNAQDNITAGVVILRALHRMADTGDHAIAGYYQGLGSVQRNGMYSDTVTYVRNIKALRGRL